MWGTLTLLKKLPAFFFATRNGNEPVRDWLQGLGSDDRRAIGDDIRKAEFAWPVGMPLCRALRHGLWEIRSHIGGKRIARVIFAPRGGRMLLLHGFIKKDRKTPKADLDLAALRMREMKSWERETRM